MLTGIIGVQNGGNCLGVGAVAVGTRVIAGVKASRSKCTSMGSALQQRSLFTVFSAVADDRDVVGDGKDVLGVSTE